MSLCEEKLLSLKLENKICQHSLLGHNKKKIKNVILKIVQ